MNLGLLLSLVLHGALLVWALVSIHTTPPLPPSLEKSIQVSILTEPGPPQAKQGDTESKQLETSGNDGSARKEPPKMPKQATPAPPPAAAAPPPPEVPPAVVKDDPPPSPTPEDKKSLDDLIKTEQAKAAAEAKAAADARAQAKAEADKKAAEKAAEKAAAEKAAEDKLAADQAAAEKAAAEKAAAEKLAAEKAAAAKAAAAKAAALRAAKAAAAKAAAAKAAAEAKKKEFNPNAIADAINNAKNPDDGKPSVYANQRPTADHAAGQKSAAKHLPSGRAAGTPDGRDAQLTADEASALFGMLRRRVKDCWIINPGVEAQNMKPVFEFELNRDGTLRGEPRLINAQPSPAFTDAANSALRAIKQCQPYQLPPDKYQFWEGVTLEFDPSKMMR